LPLILNPRTIGDVTIIRCGGRIVAGSETESLRDQITAALLDRREVILHLREVVFIDSSGLGMLVRLLTSARRTGSDLKLCEVPEGVLKILKITNLTRLFEVHESEQSAVSSVYRRRSSPEQVASGNTTVLCVDQSNDVLACLRELLRSAGYNVLTSSNLHDSSILMRATRPSLVVLGPNLTAAPGTQKAFLDACAAVPVVELGADFSRQDAGQAASELLPKVHSYMRAGGATS
jgi:anti-sigma B factor antagonist